MLARVTLEVDVTPEMEIDALEEAVVAAGRRAMGELLVAASQLLETLPPRCPHCHGEGGRWDGTDPRLLTTSFGPVVLPRRRWRCGQCRRRSRPADRLLRPLGTGRATAALRTACAEVGAAWPYAVAARFLARRCGAEVSAEQIRQCTIAAGTPRAQAQQQAAAALVAPSGATVRAARSGDHVRTRRGSRAVASDPPPARMLVELDGGWVPSRDQAGGCPLGDGGQSRRGRQRG